jgi:2-C-methyl-D-erythritol 4-phosphate cytidylyltransferase
MGAGDTVSANFPTEKKVAVVICAAGSSVRMGGLKKEYRLLLAEAGRRLTVLGAAVSAFAAVSRVETIVIAVPKDPKTGEAAARQALPPELLAASHPRIVFTPGGENRRVSVYQALSRLAEFQPAYVLIHDGARPWISPSLIERLISAVHTYRAVIPLLPLTETPKETDMPLYPANGLPNAGPVFISRNLRRANTGTAQTPQAFTFPEILSAHERAAEHEHAEYTDDAEVWSVFNGPVAVIPGELANRKITFPEDLP